MSWKLALADRQPAVSPNGDTPDVPTVKPWQAATDSKSAEERKQWGGYTLEQLHEIMDNPGLWGRLHGKVEHRLTKEAVPWRPTLLQRRMIAHYVHCRRKDIPCRMIVLKIRRGGGSTGASGIVYVHLHTHQTRAGVIGTDYEVSANMMKMVKHFNANDDFAGWLRASKVIDDAMEWSNGSTLQRYTAENPEASRSAGLHAYHASEVARWQDSAAISSKETLRSLRGSVPRHGFTLGIEESTAQGSTGSFAETFARGRWPDYAVWPSAWRAETPDGEMEFGEDLQFIRIFAAWFEDIEAVEPVTLDQVQRIGATLTKTERELIERYGKPWNGEQRLGDEVQATVWQQLAWRRKVIASEFDDDEEAFDQENPCIVAGERVGTSDGVLPIELVSVGAMSDHGQITAKYAKGTKPCIEVITKLGYRLRCTRDHLIAIDGNGFVEASESIGKRIQLQPPCFSEHPHVERWTEDGGVECALEITSEWARFLGYFMGDGCLSGNQLSFVCTRQDEDVVADIVALTTKFFGVPQTRHQTAGGTEIRIARASIAKLAHQLGLLRFVERPDRAGDGYSKRKVHVPECVWRSPKPLVREFLRGLFEADGWVSATKRSVKFFSKYTDFCREVQFLLLGFGVHSCIREISKTMECGKVHSGCELVLWSLDSDRYMDAIGFVSKRKQGRSSRPAKMNGRPAIEIGGVDEVASITSIGEREVYDLSIDGEPVFGASGVLVHNCSPAVAFASSGRHTFHRAGVAHMRTQAPQECEYGVLEKQFDGSVTFRRTPAMDSWCEVYQEPREGMRYIIGCDTMTGREQVKNSGVSDWNSAIVLRAPYVDPDTGRKFPMLVVCSLRAKNDDNADILFDQVWRMSKYYGNCMVVPEVNGSGYGFLALAKQAGMHLYRREDFDKIKKEWTEHTGWKTDDKSRPQIITALQRAIRANVSQTPGEGLLCPNKTTCSEAAAMATGPDGIDRAPHDDHCIALGLAVVNVSSATYFAGRRRQRTGPPDRADWKVHRG